MVLESGEYTELAALLRTATLANVDPLEACREWWEKSGVDWTAVRSLHRQVAQRVLIEGSRMHRSSEERGAALDSWRRGASLLRLAGRARFPPYGYARCVLEALAPSAAISLSAWGDDAREAARAWLRHPGLCPHERLRAELLECARADFVASPVHDRVRHAVGAAYERYLERRLQLAGIEYETEDASRQLGRARTPDALLTVPIAVAVPTPGGEYVAHVVHWIDSKAMFGDVLAHCEDHGPQLEAYANRFGPGLVIYWGGCVQGVGAAPGAPAPSSIVVTTDLPPHFVFPGDADVRGIPAVPLPDIDAILAEASSAWEREQADPDADTPSDAGDDKDA
jgi:hypothetical protein